MAMIVMRTDGKHDVYAPGNHYWHKMPDVADLETWDEAQEAANKLDGLKPGAHKATVTA